MANSKISALTAATTPLAGTEVLPVVQSGVTKQVSVTNLTAGRAVSMSTLAVGVASPATTGEVSGAPGIFRVSGTGGTVPQIQLSSGGVVNWSLRTNQNGASDFTIYQDSTERFLFASGGDLTFKTGNLIQGTAAKGVNFTANTGAAGKTSQLLNWYEEGTWTPTVLFNTGSTGITYSTQSGTYTRIGRQVVLNFDVRLSNKGSSTGAWQIGGFPFAAGAEGHGALHYQTGGAGINQLAQIRIISGNSFGSLYYASAGTTNTYVDTDATNTSICIGQMVYFV